MRLIIRSAVAFAASLSVVQPVAAQTTYQWNYSGTDWHTSGSWSPDGVPTSASTAVLGLFDGPTYNVPSFSANAAAGRFRILGPRGLSVGTMFGNGNTLTLGTGGVMTDPTFAFRGTFGATITLDNLRTNIATGTSYAAGSYASNVGAMDFSGFNSRFILQNGSELRLIDAAGTTNHNLTISGTLVALSSGTRITNGLGVNNNAQGAIRFQGGGNLSLQGADGLDDVFNLNQIAAASGHASVGVFAGSSGITPTTRLNLGNSTLQSGIDRFTGTPPSGGSGTLEFAFGGAIPGFTGAVGSVFLAPGPFGIPNQNGVIIDGGGSPYVILTGSVTGVSFGGRFATINPATGEVTAQLGTTLNQSNLSTALPGSNVIYKPTSTSTATLTNSISPMTLVLEPPVNGYSINLNGNTIATAGLMLERATTGSTVFDFAITNGIVAGNGPSVRNVFVLGTNTTTLSMGATFAPGAAVVKAGGGTLRLTGTTDQMAINNYVVINQGAIRARIDGPTLNFGLNNSVAFRGGILEVDASGGTSTFTRSLGVGAGQVNWINTPNVADRGSGGFAAINGNLTVNIGGDGHQLLWNGTTGDSQYFVRSGAALRFGYFTSTGIVTFANALALDDGSAANPPETRQLLLQGPSSQTSSRGIASRVRFTQVISGGPNSSLSFSGGGAVELTGANTYQGGTSVDSGVLLISNTTGSATGTGRVIINDALRGNGIIAPSSGNGFTAMPGAFVFLDNGEFIPGHLQIGTNGVNTPVTLRTSSNVLALLNGTNFDPAGGPNSYSRLTVRGTGTVDVTGSVLTVGLAIGFDPSSSERFTILDNQTPNQIDGMFAGVAQDGTVNAVFGNNSPAGTFKLSYVGNLTGNDISLTGGNDIVLYGFTPVPEPGSVLAICVVSVGAFGLFRRIRRSEQQRMSVGF